MIMASKVNEVVYSRNFSKKVGSLLEAVDTLKAAASESGDLRIARERILHSSGKKHVDVAFDVTRKTDGVVSLIALFAISGNADNMNIRISGNIQTVLDNDEKTFNSFYMKNKYPGMSDEMKSCAKEFFTRMERKIESL